MKIGGKDRPIRFGINQSIIFCRLRGITINQMDADIKKIIKNEVDGSEIRDLLFSALKDGARKEKQQFDFEPENVGDWMEEIETKDLEQFFVGLVDGMPKSKRKQPSKKK